MQLPVSDQ